MLSFWERESFLAHDVVIVGGGVVGLSTALSLKEAQPRLSVLVLERGLLPTGASTKNVGFLSVSSLTDVISDLATRGQAKTLDAIGRRRDGIRLLRERLGDEAIGFVPAGGYELLMAGELPALARLDEVNRLLRPLFGGDVYTERRDLIGRFGFPEGRVRSLIANPFEGHLHTGRAMRALLDLAQARGVRILTGAEVTDLAADAMGVDVTVHSPTHAGVPLALRAGQVAVCTNALAPRFFPGLPVVPARGQVLVTEPLADLPLRGTFHFDEGYYYFRDVGDRVILGGARHTDRDTETTAVFGLNPGIQSHLEQVLRELVLPGRDVRIAHRWAGIMGFNPTRTPIIERRAPRVTLAFACNGWGLSLGTVTGRDVAALVLS